jgi:hypothetical protein
MMPSVWFCAGSSGKHRIAGGRAVVTAHRHGWAVVALMALLVAPVWSATIVRQSEVHSVQDDGRVVVSTAITLRFDAEGDAERLSPYLIPLDSNRSLESVTCEARRPDGTKVAIPKRLRDHRAIIASYELHSSREVYELSFPALPLGSTVEIAHDVVVDPYFPGGGIALDDRDTISELQVEVRGAGEGLRWAIDGPRGADDYEIEHGSGTLVVKAHDLEGDDDAEPTVLYYAWGPARTWKDIGQWYEEILQPVERGAPAVAEMSQQLTAQLDDPRQRVEALLAFVRKSVRYVAVEVGIGGYRPSPPAEVLARRWGDCKDKSLLLVDLLGHAGIAAYPVVIRSSFHEDAIRDFPCPFLFNHEIVAVPADQLALRPDDPVGDGYLFIDPTQERGDAGWLHPGVQRKGALVVRGERSALCATPDRSNLESLSLTVSIEVGLDGSALGTAEMLLTGQPAVRMLDVLQSPTAATDAVERFSSRLPGADLQDLRWGSTETPRPAVRLGASTRLHDLVVDSSSGPALQLPDPAFTPAAAELEENESLKMIIPGVYTSRWKIHLPESWCPPAVESLSVTKECGSFAQSSTFQGGTLVIERPLVINPVDLEEHREDLAALSRAERQVKGTLIRFSCH